MESLDWTLSECQFTSISSFMAFDDDDDAGAGAGAGAAAADADADADAVVVAAPGSAATGCCAFQYDRKRALLPFSFF